MEQVNALQCGEAAKKTHVLFLCTGNSARSQMAEAFLRGYAGDVFEVYSAGPKPSTINPLTVRVMEEIGFDMTGHVAKSVRDFLGWSNFAIITVCAKAEENCPTTFPASRSSWPGPLTTLLLSGEVMRRSSRRSARYVTRSTRKSRTG